MQLKITAAFGTVLTLLAITRPIRADPIRGPTYVSSSGRIALDLITGNGGKHTGAWYKNESDTGRDHWNTAPEPKYPWEHNGWTGEGQSDVLQPISQQGARDVDSGQPAGITPFLVSDGRGEVQSGASTLTPQQGAGDRDSGHLDGIASINKSEAGNLAPLPEPGGLLSLVLLTTSVMFLSKNPNSTR